VDSAATAPDAALLRAYADTLWLVTDPGGELPLRLGIPFAAPGFLPCAIVTAYNPGSELLDATENRAANHRLLAALRGAGGECRPAIARGTGTDAEHWTEPGFLVSGLDLAQVVEIAGRFGQNAIVWVPEDGCPALIATREGFAGAAIGSRLTLPRPAVWNARS
jgi:hypothetical protein